MVAEAKKNGKSPAKHANGASPVNGMVPPEHSRWKPGQSGNPSGRPANAGWSIREWLNQMQDWSRGKLADVLADENAPVNKVSAARVWLEACSNGADFDRVMDRTAGRPAQSMDVTSGGNPIVKVLSGVSMDDI